MTTFAISAYRDDTREITIDELARAAHVHPSLVERFVDFGLLEPLGRSGEGVLFEAATVCRLTTICRLRADFGANLHSIPLILDLVDRVGALEREVRRLETAHASSDENSATHE